LLGKNAHGKGMAMMTVMGVMMERRRRRRRKRRKRKRRISSSRAWQAPLLSLTTNLNSHGLRGRHSRSRENRGLSPMKRISISLTPIVSQRGQWP